MKNFKIMKYLSIFLIVKGITNASFILGGHGTILGDIYNGANALHNTFRNNVRVEEVKNAVKETDLKITNTNTKIDANKTLINENKKYIINNERSIKENQNSIQSTNKKLNKIDTKLDKGLSMMAAMSAVEFQNLETGNIGIGAGIGHYGNSQGIAIGMAYAPKKSMRVNAKYSMTPNNIKNSAMAIGANYQFNPKTIF